ncbi:MAG: hypothetical protein HKN93_01655 [Acidimicrobiia bacterium]|nr:hypothetical protein [Acidimicrobiia bacterium]
MRIETSIDIDSSPEAVWELLSQPARHPDFATPSDSIVELGDGEVREGYVYKEKGGIPPIKSVMTWTVAEVVPNRRLVSDGTDGKVNIHVDWDLEATASGTRLSHSMELSPAWFLVPVMAVMWPAVMRKRAQAALDGTMSNLKQIVEAN